VLAVSTVGLAAAGFGVFAACERAARANGLIDRKTSY
jgi:hypothetical protein